MHTARVFRGAYRSGKLCGPHTSPLSRRIAWRRSGGVYSQSHTYIRDHMHVRVSEDTPSHPDNPVATTIRVGPPPGTPVHMKPRRSGPGIARASRTSPCPLPGAPHLTAPVPPLNLVDRQIDLRCHCSPWLWRPGRRGRRTCPWPGGQVSRGTCGRAVDGRVIVGSILRTFSRPSTTIHKVVRCFCNISSLKRTHVVGLDLVDRTCYIS